MDFGRNQMHALQWLWPCVSKVALDLCVLERSFLTCSPEEAVL